MLQAADGDRRIKALQKLIIISRYFPLSYSVWLTCLLLVFPFLVGCSFFIWGHKLFATNANLFGFVIYKFVSFRIFYFP